LSLFSSIAIACLLEVYKGPAQHVARNASMRAPIRQMADGFTGQG
jgi:hypothetical protein